MIFTILRLESSLIKDRAVLMRSIMSSGLVKVAGGMDVAANEDRVAAEYNPNHQQSNDAIAGWDPYEIWRTRVKNVRDSKTPTLPNLQPPRKR